MPGDHALGIGIGSTDFLAVAIEPGRPIETYQTRSDGDEQDALRKHSDVAVRHAFVKGLFRVRASTHKHRTFLFLTKTPSKSDTNRYTHDVQLPVVLLEV